MLFQAVDCCLLCFATTPLCSENHLQRNGIDVSARDDTAWDQNKISARVTLRLFSEFRAALRGRSKISGRVARPEQNFGVVRSFVISLNPPLQKHVSIIILHFYPIALVFSNVESKHLKESMIPSITS